MCSLWKVQAYCVSGPWNAHGQAIPTKPLLNTSVYLHRAFTFLIKTLQPQAYANISLHYISEIFLKSHSARSRTPHKALSLHLDFLEFDLFCPPPKLIGHEYVLWDMTSKLTKYLDSSCNVLNRKPFFSRSSDVIFSIWHYSFMQTPKAHLPDFKHGSPPAGTTLITPCADLALQTIQPLLIPPYSTCVSAESKKTES